MKNLGILQPGKLGDIIICLPIAKYYFDKGYQIHWPIFNNFVDTFREVINYVNFYPVTNNVYECFYEAKNILNSLDINELFDIAATFPGVPYRR